MQIWARVKRWLYRPRWERSAAPRWAWWATVGVAAIALAGGGLAWRIKVAAAPPAEAKNPLMLDAPKMAVQALDFTAVNLSGKTIKLTDYRGSVVVLNFWATWCVPCLEEMPALDRLNKTLSGRKFRVLAVDLQEPAEKVQDFTKTHRFGFDLLLDTAGEISSHYGVTRIPVTYVLDQRGVIVSRAIGPRAWDSPEGLAYFQELIQSPAPIPPASSVQAGPGPGAAPAGPAPVGPAPGPLALGALPK